MEIEAVVPAEMKPDGQTEIDYSEEIIDPGDDPKQDILETMAKGKPWAFIVADHAGDGIGLQVNVGGGIRDGETIRSLLRMTINAIPKD